MTRIMVALVAMVLVVGCQVPQPAVSSPPVPAAKVIPWLPLTPNLSLPTPSPGPQQIPVNTPPCQARDLTATVIGSNGATGHVITSFGFAGAGAECYLDGTPSVGLLDSKGSPIAFRQQAPYMPPLQPGRALIEPGPAATPYTAIKVGQASLAIDWLSQPESCPGGQPVVPAQALVAIPGGGVLSVAIPPEPAAYVCQGLGVGDFEGPYVPGPLPTTPALPAIAMAVPGSVRAGQDLTYLVTLTNGSQPDDLVALCPNYDEELIGDKAQGSVLVGGTKHIYALNCAPVGTIAPGASVTFQMVFKVPADAVPGKYTLLFGLGYWNAVTSYAQAPMTITK